MVTIKYNNVDVFSGIAATPLVARDEQLIYTGTKIARADVITLNGQLQVGICGADVQELYGVTQTLIRRFSPNFQKLEIIENGSALYSYNTAIIQSITFDESKFVNLIGFTIRITCYQDSYAENYGILDPSETYEFTETNGCLVEITRRVSARGINTSLEALQNAKNFVQSLGGYPTTFSPAGYSIETPVLVRRAETCDKLSGAYTLTETYQHDKSDQADDGGNGRFILTYTTQISESASGIVVEIQGELITALNLDLTIARAHFANLGFYSIAESEYSTIYGGSLNPTPVSFSVTENVSNSSISFSVSYSESSFSDPYLIDSTTISNDLGKICISCSVIIRSVAGCPAVRLEKTQRYYNSFDLESYVLSKWNRYAQPGWSLGKTFTSKSVGINYENGDITIQVTYCDNSIEDCGCLENFNYSISVTPAIPQFSEEPSYRGGGCYAIQNLKYNNRARIAISGSARSSRCCTVEETKSQVYTRANQVMIEYFDASDIILDEASIDVSTDGSVISFSFGWNGIQPQGLSDPYVFATF